MIPNSSTRQLMAANNEAFEHDEQPPPPYASIYSIDVGNNRITTSPSSSSLQMNFASQQPVSYNELFQSNNSTNSSFFPNLLQNINEIRVRNNQPLIHDPRVVRSKLLSDSYTKYFSEYFLKKHMQIVLTSSLYLIIFQMYFIENRYLYSKLASGIWTGLFSLLTYVVGIITTCVMFSLGGFIVINMIIATRSCNNGNRLCDNQYTTTIVVAAMLAFGGLAMISFSIYLVKLIKVYNSIQN